MFPRIDKGPIEYTLDVYRAFNPREKRECVRFHFHTVEEFNHFRYEITVEQRVAGKRIELTLKGLRARGMLLPASGSAEGMVDLFDLTGRYDVALIKPGPVTNECVIHVTDSSVRIVTAVPKRGAFIEVHTR
ncbi:MAG: hypothetical protein HY962_03910 [Ignavibacteriae bacterium]|nr:hypothetical protein [Ignavibacteriota bacterium]